MIHKIPVYGMHCKACELLIEDKLSQISWVKVKKISQNKNLIEIDIENENDLTKIKETIKELWYELEKKDVKKNNIFDYIIIFLIFIIFWLLFIIFKELWIFNWFVRTDNLSFFVILLVWLVASLSSCLAVTWWIIIWFSKYIDTTNNAYAHIKNQLSFHLWRVFWFAFLWWILWVLWWYLWSFWIFNKILLLLAWILMLYMWLNTLNILPSITKFWITMPKFLWNKILNIKNPAFAPIIWLLTFFLPCWFTQSMQVYAASSWGFLSWAIIMWTFALWTMPVLFLVWFWSSYFKDKDFSYVNKFIWVLIVYFGIFILSWLLNMINLNALSISWNNQMQISSSDLQDVKEVTVIHDWTWFKDVVLEWAKSYKLKIMPESDGLWCMFSLTIPWIDEKSYPVKKWIPILIDIKDPKPWKYKAVCTAMWMVHWNIIIK